MKIRFLASAFKKEGWRKFGDEVLNHRIFYDELEESEPSVYDAIEDILFSWQIDNGDNLWQLVERLNSLSFPLRLEYSNWDGTVDCLPIPFACKECLRSIRDNGMVPMLSVWCEGYEENYYERMMLQDAAEISEQQNQHSFSRRKNG